MPADVVFKSFSRRDDSPLFGPQRTNEVGYEQGVDIRLVKQHHMLRRSPEMLIRQAVIVFHRAHQRAHVVGLEFDEIKSNVSLQYVLELEIHVPIEVDDRHVRIFISVLFEDSSHPLALAELIPFAQKRKTEPFFKIREPAECGVGLFKISREISQFGLIEIEMSVRMIGDDVTCTGIGFQSPAAFGVQPRRDRKECRLFDLCFDQCRDQFRRSRGPIEMAFRKTG